MKKRMKLPFFLLHALTALLTLWASKDFFIVSSLSGVYITFRGLRYFTINSNLLSTFSSLLLLACLPGLGKDKPLPAWLWRLRLAGTASVTVTFCTVMLFLAPIQGYGYMLDGPNLYLHLICPLLHILSFVLLEREAGHSAPETLWGSVPVLLYGAVYMVLVVGVRRWPDFYFFNRNGLWYLSAVVMLLASALISLALWLGNRRRRSPEERSI